MATRSGGWYLNNKGVLEYRLLGADGKQTTTVLASITGLTGLKMEDGVVKVNRGGGGWSEINTETDKDITVTATEAVAANPDADPPVAAVPETATFEIANTVLGTSKISVKGSTGYAAYMDLADDSRKVHIDGTEVIKYDKSGGKATVVGDLTAGFTLDKLNGNATSATYSNAAVNQILATVTGLQKNYTASTEEGEATTVDFAKTKKDKTSGKVTEAGTITLSKATGSEVSALGTTVIKVAMSTIANNNGIAYYLALGEDKEKEETYAQVEANDEPAYWTVNKTTATYQYYSPTGYTLNKDDGTATQVNITAAKTTVVATVTGLAADLTTNITDKDQYPDAVGTGRNRIANEFKSGLTTYKKITGKDKLEDTLVKPSTTTTTNDKGETVTSLKKGSLTVDISRIVLPTKGTVTVTAGKDFEVDVTTEKEDFLTDKDATAESSNVVKDQYIWVVSGNKAIYEKVDLAYYTVTDKKTDKNGNITDTDYLDKNGNKITRIICTPQGKPTVLATITGLDADYLADEAHLVRGVPKDTNGVITHIKGINVTGNAQAAETKTEGKKTVVTKAAIPGEITLSSEVLGTTNVSLAKSDNYRLALATKDIIGEGKAIKDGTSAVALPTFSDYKWNLVGTTATLKGTVTAGYTASDDGKTITYTADGVNQTLATVSGLKKGTQLNKSKTDDERTIGNYINGSFVNGLVIETGSAADGETSSADGDGEEEAESTTGGKLSHKTIEMTNTPDEKETKYNIKALNRLPITLSKHVMDGKVTLNSNFFTLAINQDIAAGATLTQKADSRTYVLTKGELYKTETQTVKGKEKEVTVPVSGAEAIVGWHGSLGATAILKTTTPACYELATDVYGTTKTINYTAPPKATTVATIKGLNSAITEDDIEVGTTKDSNGKIPITIKSANALTTGNVTITSTDYKLALATETKEVGGETVKTFVDGLGEATLDDYEWSQATNGTVSFKATVTSPGYQLNADENTITYTKEASTPTTLATITGLRANLDKLEPTDDSDSDSDSGDTGVGEQGNVPDDDATVNETSWQFNGVEFNEKDGTITLSKSALGTSKVVLNGAGNYKLLVDEDTVDTKKKTADDAEDRWVISGTNAIFKKVIPDYYTLTDNTLTHTAAADVKYQKADKDAANYDTAKAGKSIVYGTIQGLKSGLTVSDDGQKIGYYKDGRFVEAIIVGEKDSETELTPITIKDDGVLDYKNSVKLDATAIASGYRIYLDTSTEITKTVGDDEFTKTLDQWLRPEADKNTLAWSINRGTATYKGSIGAGYANSDGTAINFSAAKTGATIATITGLNTTLTSVGDDDLEFGTGDDTNVITVTADMLGTTDAKLTTDIAILGKNYKLALDEYDKDNNPDGVITADSVEKKQIWTIDSTNATSTTATYGTWKDNYYTLNNGQNGASDTITYHKAGVADTDKIATVKGLAGNLVTIQDGQIRGIDTKTANTITLSSSVLPTSTDKAVELENLNNNEYGLALNAKEVESKAIPTPQENAIGYKISAGDYATVTITQETSAGFVYGNADTYDASASDKTKLVYKASTPTGDKSIGEISGLNKNVAVNAEGKIDGITVDTSKDEITLSQAALSNQTVKLTTTKPDSKYKLVLGTVSQFTAEPVWEAVSVKKGDAPKYKLLIGQATSGYELEEGGKQITYKGGGSGTHVATITGLKNPTNETVKIDGTKVIISAGALNAQEVSIEKADGYTGDAYTLALNNTPPAEGEEKPAGFVEASESKNAWTLTNGTATFTQTVTPGYALDSTTGKIVYTPASSIVSTFTNFNKALIEDSDYKISEDGTMLITNPDETDEDKQIGIKFTAGNSGAGTFTITDPNLLAHKNVKLTTKATGKDSTGANVTADYTIALGDDVAAEVYKPVWNKAENATVATYTRTTAAGYSLDSNSKNIVYSSDPTTVTLATVSGLNKESVVGTTAIDSTETPAIGILDGTTFTAGLVVTTPQSGNDTGVITIGNNVLNNAKVTLGKTDKYTFDLDKDDNAVPTKAEVKPVWAQDKTKAIYKNVSTAYYGLATGGKELTYNKETDYKKTDDDDTTKTTITTITGLKGGITINSDGTVKNADGTSSAGLTAGSSKVTVAAAVLGTTKVASDSYTFVLGDDVIDDEEKKYKGKTEWVDIGKGSYTYKTYDKAYYTINTDGNKEITYTTAKDITAYATVSGLKTGLTNANFTFEAADTGADNPNYSKGGVLTLGASQLGTGTAKLTTTANATGDFRLALDTTSANKVDESEIKDGTEAWTTKTTTATLTGTKTKGYTISEDAKSITYQAADKTVTLATVKGIKSGATILKDDVEDEKVDDVATGNKIITLSASQLGTSNVTVTGDGYKLALGADADKSQNDDPAWVKAANATKATFTQTTYNGFREATDGKSLIYQSKTGTVDVATINGLNKTVTQDQMAIIEEASGTDKLKAAFDGGALVVVNKATNEIYLAKDALTTSAVTLGKNDDYTLKLYGGKGGAIGGEHVENDIVFDKSTGTMSITTGDAAKWEETDGKTLKYTPSNYTNAATVTGLPKDLIFTEDETNGNELQGITVDGNKITIGAEAVFKTEEDDQGKTIVTTESRLTGGSKITLTNYTVGGTLSEYTLEVDSDDDKTADQVESTPPADHKKWVVTTKNLTLKEVTSAHYLASKVTENARNKTSTQTITYVAEKIGGDLAVITGLPTGIKTNDDGTKVFLSDGTKEVISSTMSGDNAMGDKTVKLIKDFLNSAPDKALTITIAANKVAANQYTFVSADDPDFASHADTGGKSKGYAVDYTTTPTKGTATYNVKKTAGWNRVSDTQITYVTESGELLATFNGLNTSTDYSTNGSAVAVEGNTVTVKATALTNKNVTVTTPKGSTTVYKFELDSGVVDDSDTDKWKDKTDWAVGGGTATYKTYDKAYYKLQDAAKNADTTPNSIVYVAPTKGTAYASITGLNKNVTSLDTDVSKYDTVDADGEIVITLGETELEGTTKVVLANAGAKLASYPKKATQEQIDAVDEQNETTKGHNATAAKFKLALDSGVQLSDIANAVWDNNGKVATLTGTTTKGYKLSNDQKTITYQSADSRLQTIAKVTGIKSGSQITDEDVATLKSTDGNYNENLPNLQYITLTEDHLGTDNVVLTGEGYKLALDDKVIEASETTQWQNQTDWVNSNGTFVYKTYNKAYYTLDEKTGMRVTYTAAKDDTKTAGTQHKTYLTISGLSKTATPNLAAAGDVKSATDAEGKTTITVTTAGTGVITLTNDELNKANVKLTDSQNGGYLLALDSSGIDLSTVSNDSAVISGTKATWTGTQGKGYLLANDEQNITYYSAAKTKQTIATVTGLASTVTSANNDAFSNKYDANTNTVTLGKDDLSTNVVIGGTAEFNFDDFTGGTVTGSAAADKMTFGAGNNTVNTGAGNDIVNFASKGGNTYLYANKSGNDVIRGFKADTDVIRITNVVGTTSKTTTNKADKTTTTTYTNNITVAQDTKIAGDTLVKVGANTIRLKGVTAESVTVYDSKGNIWSTSDAAKVGDLTGSFVVETPATDPGNVFADDNYAMTPNLSSIVKSSTASYTADDLVADDATALTKQSTAVSYSDKK